MKCLIVEDHLLSRRILKELLSPYGDSDIAVNGHEAVESFMLAHESKRPYDLICMDIMLPVLDGLEALRTIRVREQEMKIPASLAVKVIMTTALDDPHTVITAFSKGEATAYIVKPVSKLKLVTELRTLNLLS